MDESPVRALAVDDEPNIAELVAMALRYAGFDVRTAATGRGAITAVEDFRPHVLILDIMLPDIDGLEVARRLRAGGVDTPIVFLTARDTTEDKVRGLTLGGDDYVTKPFSVEELIARVRTILRRAGVDGDASRLTYETWSSTTKRARITAEGLPPGAAEHAFERFWR